MYLRSVQNYNPLKDAYQLMLYKQLDAIYYSRTVYNSLRQAAAVYYVHNYFHYSIGRALYSSINYYFALNVGYWNVKLFGTWQSYKHILLQSIVSDDCS